MRRWLIFKLFQNSKDDQETAQDQGIPRRSSMPHSPSEQAQPRQPENESKPETPAPIFSPEQKPRKRFGGIVLQKRWVIGRTLGRGSFGVVCASYDKQTKQSCAIKIDHRKRYGMTLLEVEYKTYLQIFGTETPTGFLHPIKFLNTQHGDFLVLPLLGKTLSNLYQEKKGDLGFKFVCDVGIQMLTRLEYVHGKGFLHLDIKPENMMLGRGDNASVVYLIDFGLSKRYLNDQGEQKPYKTGLSFRGTRTLASIHIHSRVERAPRDDLESLFYTLILLQKGKLPWTNTRWSPNMHGTDFLRMDDKMLDMKRKHRRVLCNGAPQSFQLAWRTVAKMRYESVPDYSGLKHLLLLASQEHQDEGEAQSSNE